jgi:hypothetical protein
VDVLVLSQVVVNAAGALLRGEGAIAPLRVIYILGYNIYSKIERTGIYTARVQGGERCRVAVDRQRCMKRKQQYS